MTTTTLRQRAARLLRAAAFAALLLVPVVESGHRHAGDGPSAPCSVCVVVHHAPVAVAPVIAIADGAVAWSPALVAAAPDPRTAERAPACGRAPPVSSRTSIV